MVKDYDILIDSKDVDLTDLMDNHQGQENAIPIYYRAYYSVGYIKRSDPKELPLKEYIWVGGEVWAEGDEKVYIRTFEDGIYNIQENITVWSIDVFYPPQMKYMYN